jgi:hypothetical protein
MGRQFAYYATPADEAVIVDEITSRLGGRFIRRGFQHPEEMAVPSLPVIDSVFSNDKHFLIYCPSFQDSLVIASYPTGVHSVRQGDSLIIEFSRSYIIGRKIFDGRLWYAPRRDDGTEKPAGFLAWANRLFSWIKRHFTFRKERGCAYYLGPDVVTRLQEGSLELA